MTPSIPIYTYFKTKKPPGLSVITTISPETLLETERISRRALGITILENRLFELIDRLEDQKRRLSILEKDVQKLSQSNQTELLEKTAEQAKNIDTLAAEITELQKSFFQP